MLDFGVDKDGNKTFRDQALWIGQNLGMRGTANCLVVGAWGADMLSQLPIFRCDNLLEIEPSASLDAALDEVLVRAVQSNPFISPLAIPPEPWVQVQTGALPRDHWARASLICGHHRASENAVRKAIGAGKMSLVLVAINLLQAVPFKINAPVLDFVLKSPPKADYVTELASWQMATVTAEALAELGCFYTPLVMDFRGRLYPMCHFSFIREDYIRGLFLFADGEPIGQEGLFWLKAHVASRANGNKFSRIERPGEFDDVGRAKWTDDNIGTIRAIGGAVLRGDDPAKLEWALPKDPVQFIAACVELTRALEVGPGFITRLPVTFDGSCSGLQHLTHMTKAPEGRSVNLFPADEADDFYRRVAFSVFMSDERFAAVMKGPFDRDLCKRPAMTYFYGARPGGYAQDKRKNWHPYGMTKQVHEILEERGQSTKLAKALAHAINNAVEDTVPSARAVRDYLEAAVAGNKKQLRWTNALGLPVLNVYFDPDCKRIKTRVNGRWRKTKLAVGDKEEPNLSDAVSAVTANFIHSCDAAHLQMVVLAAAKEGISMVCVHDMFGTIAPQAPRLKQILGEQLYELHEYKNMLMSLHADLSVKPPFPVFGDADRAGVLQSPHAFK
jgi:DNA-directed RNA polymerase